MIPPESAIVTEGLQVRLAPREALFQLEIWGAMTAVEDRLQAALPLPCRSRTAGNARILWWEPGTWLVRAPIAEHVASLERLTLVAGGDGAVTDVSSAFTRLHVEGPLWRDLLMIGGVFDAEAPDFGPGCVAGTVIHHLPIRLDVLSDAVVEAYVPPSYAEDLLGHWTRASARIDGVRADRRAGR